MFLLLLLQEIAFLFLITNVIIFTAISMIPAILYISGWCC